jgi:allantoin racemase
MKLLLLNPNTTEAVTSLLMDAARPAASAGTAIEAMTAPRGVPYIATRAEALVGGLVTLETLAARQQDFDAAIIAAFGDPGLGAARELFPLPVVGLAEAGMLAASMLGRKFSIVSFSDALEPWYRECVEWHGMSERCAGIRTLGGGFRSIAEVQQEKEALLVGLAREAAEADRADVIVLAGAPLAGLAARVRDQIDVPVVECVAAAVRLAEMLVALNPRKPVAGTYRRPGAKDSTGLDPVLAAWIAHREAH